jgi:hypothetical protein
MLIFGILMTAFGWTYPHFLPDSDPLAYLYASPTGLIPCPTISIVIGLSLILNGFSSRVWCFMLAVVGFFYGLFGAVRLGVTIDWVLFVGALAITFAGLFQKHPEDDRVSEGF